MINKVILVGNLGKDVELRTTPSNINVGSLSDPIGTADRISYIRSQKSSVDTLSTFVQTLFV